MKEKNRRIVLIGNYIPDRQESMQRFAAMLATGLKAAGFITELWCPPAVFGKLFDPSETIAGKWLGYIDKWVIFPVLIKCRLLFKSKANKVFHICDHSNSPYLQYFPRSACSITCHDVLAIRGALGDAEAYCKPSRTGVFFQRWILRNLAKAIRLAAVSELTIRQLTELTDLPDTRRKYWQVIHNALNAHFNRMEPVTAGTVLNKILFDCNRPFILHVGSSHPRKNRKMLIEMVACLEDRWAGNICFAGEAPNEELLAIAGKLGLRERIVSVPKPDHETLVALYSTCEAFIFPSFSEGFGWPLIEAQACGAPVIASNIEPMPEVSGGAAIHANPHDPQEFAEAFLELQKETSRNNLINGGHQNIKRFGPVQMIQSYLLMYNLISPTFNNVIDKSE